MWNSVDLVTLVYVIAFLLPWVVMFWPGDGGS
jgi:hypothetical protein